MPTAKTCAVLIAASLLFAACTNQKDPAEKAVAQVESSLSEIRADAEKYAADELKETSDTVNALKASLARHDYGAVVRGAPAASNSIATLKQTVAQRKADAEQMLAGATAEWNEFAASIPPMVDALQKRVDQLAKTRKFPKGLDKAGFDAAKIDFENLKTGWSAASAEFASGTVAEALRKARVIKSQGDDLMQRLEAKPG
jgi:hypothetical protein